VNGRGMDMFAVVWPLFNPRDLHKICSSACGYYHEQFNGVTRIGEVKKLGTYVFVALLENPK